VTVDEIDRLDPDAFAVAVSPLFEGAPRFLARLQAARPFRDERRLFETALRIAREMPEAEQVELLDAHPRIGASPGSVSAASFREQGYDREAADAAAEAERARVQDALDQRNARYEERFGFRFVVFVAGRSRAAIVPELERRLRRSRAEELEAGLAAVVDIAEDRWRKQP
jgi:2-oxo-4-hydroxy-4-carboxy-5-ureidoimidazoline decarboxylase